MTAAHSENLNYFHAGPLFNLKELAGNVMMAQAILRRSDGRYRAILPQNLELTQAPANEIRNADLLALLKADVALFHFDGSELDSGTVAEFVIAKFADIPAVLLRTDFRRGGDGHADAWNLMLSDYPRTRRVIIHAMELYHQKRHPVHGLENAVEFATEQTAFQVVAAFDEVRKLPPVLPINLREPVYHWLTLFAHSGLPIEHAAKTALGLLEGKINKGLL